MARPVTIIGGGLAGLALGIELRQSGVPVSVCEAGTYPRHRVCGEFISGRGQAALARWRLPELLAQARIAQTAAFFSTTVSTGPRALPCPATCVARFVLDAALAKKFRELGGDLQTGTRWLDRPNPQSGPEGIVRATGRRASAGEAGPRWFGLKIHARNVPLTADLEMHFSPRGYVGLCKINDGVVNICGLFRKGESEQADNGRDLLRGSRGSPLHRRLAAAEFMEDSFCAVGGLSLRPRRAANRAETCVGDAITMIAPVTGNGMSMAFESAALAAAPLVAWSREDISWAESRQQIARNCDAVFARRLRWADWLQRLMLTSMLQTPLIQLAARNDLLWRLAFAHTR